MGLLEKIFSAGGTTSEKVQLENDNKPSSTMAYREKYLKMESEGKKISWWEYEKSIDQGWPYPVATEAEMDQIEHCDRQALRGHAPDITALITCYVRGLCEDANDPEITVYQDDEKAKYWKQLLVNGGRNGNRAYQAALIATNGLGGKMYGWINEEEFDMFDSIYKEALLNDAEAGDPEAQYAVAEFCLGDAVFQSDIRKKYAESAMNAGITDAAFLLDKIYESEAYANGGQWSFDDKIKVYVNAADNTTGAMLGWIQDCVADGYRDGDGDLPKDKNLALRYYTLAAQNGNTSAMSTLELYKSHPEIMG